MPSDVAADQLNALLSGSAALAASPPLSLEAESAALNGQLNVLNSLISRVADCQRMPLLPPGTTAPPPSGTVRPHCLYSQLVILRRRSQQSGAAKSRHVSRAVASRRSARARRSPSGRGSASPTPNFWKKANRGTPRRSRRHWARRCTHATSECALSRLSAPSLALSHVVLTALLAVGPIGPSVLQRA